MHQSPAVLDSWSGVQVHSGAPSYVLKRQEHSLGSINTTARLIHIVARLIRITAWAALGINTPALPLKSATKTSQSIRPPNTQH